jgi:crotonobetainyl-CoA:carnitine CoA-transferase CaiB-like acyl-CoA transferase
MTNPLGGLLVVSLKQAVAAPCAAKLADAGARVIKVERSEGDFCPRLRQRGARAVELFRLAEARRKAVVADVKQPQDAALLHRQTAHADVFIQEPRAGRRRPIQVRVG